MLVEPERTPYDVRFRLLGFPVRVHPFFWLGAALLGFRYVDIGPEYLLIWMAVVFLSILVHELGHAVAFRRYGADADIVMYAFGGLAIPTFTVSGRGRRIIIALAGPFAGFILCGLLYGSNTALEWAQQSNGLPANGPHVWFFYISMVFVNLWWGVFNLLPVYPLDGGQVSRELCGMKWGGRGKRISLQISLVVALLVAAYSVVCELDRRGGAALIRELPPWFPMGTFLTAILFGLLAVSSYQMLQQPDWTDNHWDDKAPWER